MQLDRAWGALAGLGIGAALFGCGGAIPYGIFVVALTGNAMGHPALLFDPARRTDFGPDLTPLGVAVYGVLWFAPFVAGGMALGPTARRALRG